MSARFKVFYAWWPIREVRRDKDGFDFTGRYYWRTKVNAVKNLHHGWIAFEDSQTKAHLERCPACKQLLGEQS
jgi:hypothetical protein